jgi:hypothetical protein
MAIYNGDEKAWPHGRMIDMAKSPAEISKEIAPQPCDPCPPSSVPEYPWGLSISLEDDTLKKLGLDGDLPQAGDILEFFATAKVTCASTREEIDTATGAKRLCCRIELQIVAMLPHEEESAAEDRVETEQARSAGRRNRFYGDSMAGYQDAREAGNRP